MSWWLWVLIWAALVVGAVAFLFLMLRRLWRQLRLLFADLGTATDRLTAVSAELERLQERTERADPPATVFDQPGRLRQQRFRDRSKQRGSRRRTRT